MGKAQSCAQPPSLVAERSAGDPRIQCGAHESRQLAWLLYNGSEYCDDICCAVGT
jgi:hypothetical protein